VVVCAVEYVPSSIMHDVHAVSVKACIGPVQVAGSCRPYVDGRRPTSFICDELRWHITYLRFRLVRVYLPSSSSCLPFGVRTDEFLNCSSPTLIRRTRHSTDVGP